MCMNTQRITITLPYGLTKQLKAEVPYGKRNDFIVKAILEKFTILNALEKSLKANCEFDKKEYQEIWEPLELED